MIAEDPCFHRFSRPAERDLYDPPVIAPNGHSQVGNIRDFQLEFVMIRIRVRVKAFGFAVHAHWFVTGSPLVGKTLFLGIDEPKY